MDAIEQVREGMKVVAADGETVGTVDSLKMGDPGAITPDGQLAGEGRGPIAEFMASVFGAGPEISEEQAERLLRLGYIRIDGKGLAADSYRAADQLDRVEADTVYLK